ncbi:MAG TPA: Hsp20/alpha crystallin family protein [Spirochaetia bacterium]|nr:Hsp20/alpha crystallin family protein [Spirochaetia bacterium]
MDLVRWTNGLPDPFTGFDELQQEINKLFEEATKTPGSRGIFERTFSPALDVLETPDTYRVVCDLPGMDMDDIEISLSSNVLTLKGEKKEAPKQESDQLYREETSVGRFQRTLQLPLAVDADKVSAVLKNGVLSIELPKRADVKPRSITVRAS